MVDYIAWYVWVTINSTPTYVCAILWVGLMLMCVGIIGWVMKKDNHVE